MLHAVNARECRTSAVGCRVLGLSEQEDYITGAGSYVNHKCRDLNAVLEVDGECIGG